LPYENKESAAKHEEVTKMIEAALPGAVQDVFDFRGERTLIMDKNQIRRACEFLRENGFNLLEDIVADDLFPEYPRFAVNYHLYSLTKNHRIRLRLPIEDPEDGPETIAGLWPVATWLEMEVWDLMGIRFNGNNALRRLFLPEDWVGFPLRKDYPLGYEEIQFSFNWQAVDAKKPYAKD
jgi:NADH-quinone oxidoreductase subunit C